MKGINEFESGITKAIKDTTIQVFSTMLMLEVQVKESFVKDEKNVSTDLIASLHFFGEMYMGKIAVFSNGTTACRIAEAMLGTETKEVDDGVKDGMGEIVNMIAGGAKVKLVDTLGEIHLLTPWVITGRNLTISSSEGSGGGLSIDSQAQFSWIMTEFTFDNGRFLVGVQPNAVPAKRLNKSKLEETVEVLMEENKRLKEEIKRLKMEAVK